MGESQNVEYKESWRDEYLKWVCGFANARGGRIFIGIRDDGEIVGVPDSKRLMEDIPNKIKDTMGILAEVNLLSVANKDYIEVKVNPSTYPVSYHGEYHYRSGSTKQQLRGAALTEFLVEKTGYHWDAVPVDAFGLQELAPESLAIFRREALNTGRMSKADLDISDEELLDHLDLLVDGQLKRAAVMLFGRRPGRLVSGCYVKIGKFGHGSDLQYQDTLGGSLFQMADRVLELIFTKYLKASVSYRGDVRVETFPFPREAVREVIYNAICHNNYAASVPIQVRIEDDAMSVSNSCVLPRGWTVDTLMASHRSVPYNPSIANAFWRAGYIEAWGRGIQKVMEVCQDAGMPAPEYLVLGDGLTVRFSASAIYTASTTPICHLLQQDDRKGDRKGDRKDDRKRSVFNRTEELDENLLVLLAEGGDATLSELAEQLEVSYSTVQRAVRRLRRTGRLRRSGSRRFGVWDVL